jgi:hypothetical protein
MPMQGVALLMQTDAMPMQGVALLMQTDAMPRTGDAFPSLQGSAL